MLLGTSTVAQLEQDLAYFTDEQVQRNRSSIINMYIYNTSVLLGTSSVIQLGPCFIDEQVQINISISICVCT